MSDWKAIDNTLDVSRTLSGKDEATAIVVRSCDVILDQVTKARSALRVSGRVPMPKFGK